MIPAERIRQISKKANSEPKSKSKIFVTESFDGFINQRKLISIEN
jgi:hypothetical protein